MKVLLCEDDDVMTELLDSVLEAEGYAVSVTHDGVECMEAMAAGKPDLLILDLEMPRKNGFDVLEDLKGRKGKQGCRVIVISANQAPKDVQRARDLGADLFLIKPFEVRDLLEQVKRLLQGRHG